MSEELWQQLSQCLTEFQLKPPSRTCLFPRTLTLLINTLLIKGKCTWYNCDVL
jgi:hypothetical protein